MTPKGSSGSPHPARSPTKDVIDVGRLYAAQAALAVAFTPPADFRKRVSCPRGDASPRGQGSWPGFASRGLHVRVQRLGIDVQLHHRACEPLVGKDHGGQEEGPRVCGVMPTHLLHPPGGLSQERFIIVAAGRTGRRHPT